MRAQTARMNMSFGLNKRNTKNTSFVGSMNSERSSVGGYAFGSTIKAKVVARNSLGPGDYSTSSRLIQKSSSAAGIGLGVRPCKKNLS